MLSRDKTYDTCFDLSQGSHQMAFGCYRETITRGGWDLCTREGEYIQEKGNIYKGKNYLHMYSISALFTMCAYLQY